MKSNIERFSFFSGFFWKFNEQIMGQLVSFIVSIILARLLSPKDYGLVSLVNVFIVLANVFVTSGLSTALIQKKDATDMDFSTVFYCNFALAWLLYFLIFLLSPNIAIFYHDKRLINIVRIFALNLPISSINSIQQAYVARKIAFRKIFFATSVASIISGLVGIFLAYKGWGVWALVIQILSNTIMATLVLFIQIPWHPQLIFSIKSAKELINYGWKVLAADFLGTFFAQLRNLVIGRFYTATDLAFYNRGDQFPNLLSNNIDNTISSVLFPVMSKYGDDVDKLKSMVRRSLRISSYIITPIMFGLAVIAKPLILILLTNKWLPAVPYMQILCISNVFSTITNTNLQVMKASGRSDVLLKIELIKKPIYIILLFIGIKFSVFMVAVTMAIYSFYAACVNMRPNKKIINYSAKDQLSDVFPSIFLSVLMAIITSLINFLNLSNILTLVIQVMLGIIIYVLGSKIFRLEPYTYMKKYIVELVKEKLRKN